MQFKFRKTDANFDMKKWILAFLLLPVFAVAQVKSKPIKGKPGVITKRGKSPKSVVKPAEEGFTINAVVSGFPDGTKATLLNGQSGQPEGEAEVKAGRFTLKGKVESPDFRVILFNKQPPYITLFLDNSTVNIEASKDALDQAKITGSPAHQEFEVLNRQLFPFRPLFAENAPANEPDAVKARKVCTDFVTANPASYVAPLAIIRFSQITPDIQQTEKLYELLKNDVKASPMAGYIQQQITEAKRNAIGSVLPEFSQADTSGVQVTLSSFRGKYVLIDFWASWCRPCRQENPNVVANFQKYKDKNFTVLGISLDKARPAWIEAIHMDGLTWTHLSDLQGWANAVAQQFQIQSIPQNILIDPEGKIIGKNLRGAALEQKLQEVLH